MIPAEIAKTERREVIELEPVFWEWWALYGRKGRLRLPNYNHRWVRVRVLAAIWQRDGLAAADALATRTPTAIATDAAFAELRGRWPWNARRRTFTTFHVAKEQSADKTALIIRHRGDTYTLHNSYRGMGVTQEQGKLFFARKPAKVATPLPPPAAPRPPRGIVRMKIEAARKKLETSAA